MGLWERVRRLLGQAPVRPAAPSPKPAPVRPPIEDDPPEPQVPEVTAEEFKQALAGPVAPLVLDIRELYEWRQVRMSLARHIPMNEVPQHLDELRREAAQRAAQAIPIVVVCAHGSRSYSVAAWLIEQGVAAGSLQGGISQWRVQGGEVEQGQ